MPRSAALTDVAPSDQELTVRGHVTGCGHCSARRTLNFRAIGAGATKGDNSEDLGRLRKRDWRAIAKHRYQPSKAD
jgi:hypothetical protein